MIYQANSVPGPIGVECGWEDAAWAGREVARIASFRPESNPDGRPQTEVKLAYSKEAIHGIFRVSGERARCVRTNYFDEVWKDSCVEFFVQPRPDMGYFNCEFNCGGGFLCGYITDPARNSDGVLRGLHRVPEGLGASIQTRSSRPGATNPETAEPVDWTLAFRLPVSVFEPYIGKVELRPGQSWRCNFFKCAEEVSRPHWASWAPVDEFNFHLPRCFGTLRFSV